MLKRTPFYDFHVSMGAKLVDFAGWEMPIMYRGIIDEHVQTRQSGSIFDVSHMGRLQFGGKDATAFLNHIVTRNVAEQKVGQSRYSLVCNESGGVMDDIIVSRDEKNWIMVCNASNRGKLVPYFHQVREKTGMAVGAPVLAQEMKSGLRQRDIAVLIAFASLDMEQHAGTVDLRDTE